MDISRNDEQSTSPAPSVSSLLSSTDMEDLYVRKLQELQQRAAELRALFSKPRFHYTFNFGIIREMSPTKNTELQNITNKQFASAVKQVEHRFRGIMPQPACQELQAEVLKCYQENTGDILNCSSLVNAFTACVNRARIDQTLFHIKEVKLMEVLKRIAEENEQLQPGKEE